MTVVECTSALPYPDRPWEATLSIHGKHEFTIKKAPGSGFTCSTRDDFLGDNLWLENLEEAVSVANGVETVLKEALGVYKCIAGPASDKGSDGESDYEYQEDMGMDNVDDTELAAKYAEKAVSANKATGTWEDRDEVPLIGGYACTYVCIANTRLMRDLSRLMRTDTSSLGFTLELVHDDNLTLWRVKVFGFTDCPLAEDMVKLKKERKLEHIELEMKFPEDYPYSPPFCRVVYPRFIRQTGYILDGAFCFELLTKQGWTPTNDIETVIVQLRFLMVFGHARIDFNETTPYCERNSLNAFRGAAKQHNWAI
ncbi:ubiquitin-conjugating enzyme/RWD-like protein [Tribonema minus]|uniref:Ubiquitin-conjugating enzyme/RWD-like protein n=1 Tax=Tribonema minus TaxID=303371 RepID=A0A835ZBS4_9STRA|nr:ubiquitin-conjugating enzyme/RWD-like protein [Tribonema minus]